VESEERYRAWFLIESGDAGVAEVRQALWALDPEEENEDLVVIRIDQVDDNESEYDLVAPVDCSSEEGLELVEEQLSKMGATYRRLMVIHGELAHEPYPPHVAAGFISFDEFATDTSRSKANFYGRDVFAVVVSHGRQRHSPGFTPWG
jgi:hypothetical protein